MNRLKQKFFKSCLMNILCSALAMWVAWATCLKIALKAMGMKEGELNLFAAAIFFMVAWVYLINPIGDYIDSYFDKFKE